MYLIDEEIEHNPAIKEFIEGITPYEVVRFQQILQHLGYTMFINGLQRPVEQRGLSLEQQGWLLIHETDLFAQGAAEMSDYLSEED